MEAGRRSDLDEFAALQHRVCDLISRRGLLVGAIVRTLRHNGWQCGRREMIADIHAFVIAVWECGWDVDGFGFSHVRVDLFGLGTEIGEAFRAFLTFQCLMRRADDLTPENGTD